MREVIALHVGGCGNNISEGLWQQMITEHNLTAQGELIPNNTQNISSGINTCFREIQTRYVPRSIQVDLNNDSIDRIRSIKLGHLFSLDNQIMSKAGSASTFAAGYYGWESNDIAKSAMDTIRRQAESCQNIEAIQVFNSATGGSGSGLQARIVSYFFDDYPNVLSYGLTVAPQSDISNNTLDIYNLVLGFRYLVDKYTLVNMFQNDSLNRICYNNMNILRPKLIDMNSVIARVATGITQPMRFSGSLNTSFRKICTNIIPFPRMHFALAGLAPLNSSSKISDVNSLIETAYGRSSFMTKADWHEGYTFATANIFSGSGLSNSEVQTALFDFSRKNQTHYSEWVSDPSHCAVIQSTTNQPSLTTLINSSNIRLLLTKYTTSFSTKFRRKAFLHHFMDEGMYEMEFIEGESNMNDLTFEFPESMYNYGYQEDMMDDEFDISYA